MVTKICENCGKEFKVIKCRENTAKYCCRKCSDESKKASNNVICSFCGKPFHLKNYQINRYNRTLGIFCSRECLNEAKKIYYVKEGNHQYGLTGNKNASFKNKDLVYKNHKVNDIHVYFPNHPYCSKTGRIKLHRLLVEARALTNNQHPRYADRRDNKLNIVYKKEPLDDYRVTFVVEYDITPSVGFKMTGSYGDKGVICSIVDPIHMPVDAEGNRADVIMDAGSTINRMNAGRPYEQYFGSAARDVTRQIRRTLFLPDGRSLDEVDPKTTRDAVYNISKQNPEAIQQAHNTALDLYKICSPKQYERYASFDWNNIVEHVQDIVECGIYLYMPIDNPLEIVDVVKNIEARFKLCYGPVTFINMKGERITTKHPVRIGPYYMMLLEKIADDWSSVAYSKLHHFGILTPMNKFEKYSQPYRNSPIRTMGETESRLYSSYCGRVAAAEMIDRNNNPSAHKAMVATILDAEYPSNVDVGVDRSKIPFGNSKPLQLVRHVAFCYGWEMDYVPGKDIYYEVNHETNKS